MADAHFYGPDSFADAEELSAAIRPIEARRLREEETALKKEGTWKILYVFAFFIGYYIYYIYDCVNYSDYGRWSHTVTIPDHAIYKRYMEDIPTSKGYTIYPSISVVGLEDEMEHLFSWSAAVAGPQFFAIGKVKSIIFSAELLAGIREG